MWFNGPPWADKVNTQRLRVWEKVETEKWVSCKAKSNCRWLWLGLAVRRHRRASCAPCICMWTTLKMKDVWGMLKPCQRLSFEPTSPQDDMEDVLAGAFSESQTIQYKDVLKSILPEATVFVARKLTTSTEQCLRSTLLHWCIFEQCFDGCTTLNSIILLHVCCPWHQSYSLWKRLNPGGSITAWQIVHCPILVIMELSTGLTDALLPLCAWATASGFTSFLFNVLVSISLRVIGVAWLKIVATGYTNQSKLGSYWWIFCVGWRRDMMFAVISLLKLPGVLQLGRTNLFGEVPGGCQHRPCSCWVPQLAWLSKTFRIKQHE